jgi:hypothetical protein
MALSMMDSAGIGRGDGSACRQEVHLAMSKRGLTGQGETLLFPVDTVIDPRSDHFFYQELRASRHIVGMKPASSVQTISRTGTASETYLGVSTVDGEGAFERRVGHIPGLSYFTRCPCLRSRERMD